MWSYSPYTTICERDYSWHLVVRVRGLLRQKRICCSLFVMRFHICKLIVVLSYSTGWFPIIRRSICMFLWLTTANVLRTEFCPTALVHQKLSHIWGCHPFRKLRNRPLTIPCFHNCPVVVCHTHTSIALLLRYARDASFRDISDKRRHTDKCGAKKEKKVEKRTGK